MKSIKGFKYQYYVFTGIACVIAFFMTRPPYYLIAIAMFAIAAIRGGLIWKAPEKVFYYAYATGTVLYAISFATICVKASDMGYPISNLGYLFLAALVGVRCYFLWKYSTEKNK